MKSIDNLTLAEAKEIYEWRLKEGEISSLMNDVQLKARVRTYLRATKQSPDDCLMKIWKEKEQTPKRKAF